MRRREFITFVGGVGAWLLAPHAATAQPSDRIRRIAMLSGFAATDPEAQARVAALQQGLKDLGWAEGRNLSIEFRWGTGGSAQMRTFARELVDLTPDLILGMTTPAVTALVQETNTIPILFVHIVDPLGRGFVSNMARPGGNVTGLSIQQTDLAAKRMELLREVIPGLSRLAILANIGNPAAVADMREVQLAMLSEPIRRLLKCRSSAFSIRGERPNADCHGFCTGVRRTLASSSPSKF